MNPKEERKYHFMKKAKRKSTTWLTGGLAALIFLGSGSMATAQVVTSYNDLAWTPRPDQHQYYHVYLPERWVGVV